ncbi:pentatricopeptide repeat-containing protein [Hordeum vulgare]|uniref:Smr domain-containing protein n=1 Tax=Hordeum vulgare subsp. vulgare TaxID=112509 RepID=A0A8I6XVG1_HORVV|nr:pentatricopeptide repeat-containing protein At1g74850, chloroplastic isoform X1 [Hordeum vulgare subsp. vulgare]KAE8794036.1 pentatricopeptide repeat-containing protein [Hordeum vulgare]
MALVSTTTVASSSSYHCDHQLRPARSWCRPRSRGGGGGGGRPAVLARARGQLTATPKEDAAPAAAGAGERGRYSYEVDSLIDRLSNLAPRGSIARCLETAKHRLTLQDFAAVYREFSRRGDWQRSMRLFKYMQRQSWCRPDEHIHAIVIGVLGRQGPALLDKCLEVFQDLPADARTALSYTSLIAAYARNALHDDARALLDQMKAHGVAPTAATYNTVLAACARAADPPVPFDMLLGLFAEMRHDPSPAVRPDLTTYNTLLAAAAVRSLSDQSEMLLHTMLEAGIMPDNASYRYIVDAFANAGDLSRVAELFREMADTGHTPDPSAYLGLMEAHTRIGATAEAVAVLRQMQADGCAPTAATYRVLLDQYGKQGRFDGVRELFREMRTAVPPDTATYNVLFNVFGDGGFFKEVVELFHDMLRTGIEPDMETCEGVLAACGQGGLHEDAREVLDYITKEGMVPTAKAYTGLIEALGHAAMYEEAYVAFNMMTEIGSLPTIETYNSLANVFAKGGLFREAESVFSRMTNSAGIQKSKDSYDALIEAYCQGSQLDDAVKAYMEMRKSRFNPDERSLEGVLNAYCIAGVIDESKEQFEEIRSNMAVPSIIAYCMMLSLYARNDRWADAYDLLEEMKTNRASNTHQVIASMIKGEYDDSSNWQMVEYVLDSSNLEGCDYSLRFFNALLDVLWWFGQKARAARVLDHAVSYGLFPELFRDTKLVWSLDVHRMSVGGALVAVSVWLNKLYARVKREKDLPQLASVVVLRGEMEKSTVTRGLPISKVVYSFLNDTLSASFHYPKWNKGRVICLKSQLKKLQAAIDSSNGAAIPGFVHMTDSRLPPPGSKVYTREQPQVENGSAHSAAESLVEEEKESELLAL